MRRFLTIGMPINNASKPPIPPATLIQPPGIISLIVASQPSIIGMMPPSCSITTVLGGVAGVVSTVSACSTAATSVASPGAVSTSIAVSVAAVSSSASCASTSSAVLTEASASSAVATVSSSSVSSVRLPPVKFFREILFTGLLTTSAGAASGVTSVVAALSSVVSVVAFSAVSVVVSTFSDEISGAAAVSTVSTGTSGAAFPCPSACLASFAKTSLLTCNSLSIFACVSSIMPRISDNSFRNCLFSSAKALFSSANAVICARKAPLTLSPLPLAAWLSPPALRMDKRPFSGIRGVTGAIAGALAMRLVRAALLGFAANLS
ncbi:Uncharacterised protein [Candidatus Venteria ishoeyi]|uniref:Uncharacterized protein n=1 Tax=Candidatus Venteria ishoeyi TaxID=1899563 RepID=A0A1H6FE27_9GAMM|nr:Uncharacterised protein [Candidatus Venteria ishoeyi]